MLVTRQVRSAWSGSRFAQNLCPCLEIDIIPFQQEMLFFIWADTIDGFRVVFP